MTTTCFNCGQTGHMAGNCPLMFGALPANAPLPAVILCKKCARPDKHHDLQAQINCAWRGLPCITCGHPPHRNGALNRCESYAAASDTDTDRAFREKYPRRTREELEIATGNRWATNPPEVAPHLTPRWEDSRAAQ